MRQWCMDLIFEYESSKKVKAYDISNVYLIILLKGPLLKKNMAMTDLNNLLKENTNNLEFNNLIIHNLITKKTRYAYMPYIDITNISISPDNNQVVFYTTTNVAKYPHFIVTEIETLNILFCDYSEKSIVYGRNVMWSNKSFIYFKKVDGNFLYELCEYQSEAHTILYRVNLSLINVDLIKIISNESGILLYGLGNAFTHKQSNVSTNANLTGYYNNCIDLLFGSPQYNPIESIHCINNIIYYAIKYEKRGTPYIKLHKIIITDNYAVAVNIKGIQIPVKRFEHIFFGSNTYIEPVNYDYVVYYDTKPRCGLYYATDEVCMKIPVHLYLDYDFRNIIIKNMCDLLMINTNNKFYRVNLKKWYEDIIELLYEYDIPVELQDIIKQYM